MKSLAGIGTALAAAAVIALGAPAAPAFAGGFTLNLSAPSTPVVGQPMILRATGTLPVEWRHLPYWFSLNAIPPSVTSTCPEDHFVAAQFATGAGGSIVVLTQREVADEAGNFSIPVAITPSAPGSVLLCGYTDDGESATLAVASLMLDIRPASSAGGGSHATQGGERPGSVPVEVARGIRMCRALFGPAEFKGCVRNLVKDAKAACRKQVRSRRGQARCVRRVRRVSRRYL